MKLIHVTLLSTLLSGAVIAQEIKQNVKIVGTINQTIKLVPATSAPTKNNLQATSTKKIKTIQLLKIELTQQAQQNLTMRAKKALTQSKALSTSISKPKYPTKVQLGMNQVPVLDQGRHGTCVTFASTAAFDAALNKGDYISQLCQLQLGNYLQENAYVPSGWNGSWGPLVLNQMQIFGIVNQELQKSQGCGDLNAYPVNEQGTPEGAISATDYRKMSEDLNERVVWSPILSVAQTFIDRIDTNKTLQDVKASLAAGDRLTFGVLLFDFDLGTAGAIGKNKAENDTWVLTPETIRDIYLKSEFAGHEMIITGYDDHAIAVDEEGREYRGLLTLRNSWGNKAGDQGNFYMSYDYFKLLVLETQRIRSIIDEGDEINLKKS